MRSDNILTTLGERAGGYRRLWVEDSASRLSNNGFIAGTGFVVEPRQGPGANFRPSILGDCHVSRRRGAAILSYESTSLARIFETTPEVRVKISVNLVQVFPSLRVFHVRKHSTETWSIGADSVLTTPKGQLNMLSGREPILGRPLSINLSLSDRNLVAATDFIARVKPAEIRLTPADTVQALGQGELFAEAPSTSKAPAQDGLILAEVARQFFTACGWTRDTEGVFRR